MTIVDTALGLAGSLVRYALAGGVAVFVGHFIGDQWKTRAIPRWSSWLAIIAFGVLVWHAPEFAAAMGSNAEFNQ